MKIGIENKEVNGEIFFVEDLFDRASIAIGYDIGEEGLAKCIKIGHGLKIECTDDVLKNIRDVMLSNSKLQKFELLIKKLDNGWNSVYFKENI